MDGQELEQIKGKFIELEGETLEFHDIGEINKTWGLWRTDGWWAANWEVFGTCNRAYAEAQCMKVNKGEIHNRYRVRSFEEWFDTMEAP